MGKLASKLKETALHATNLRIIQEYFQPKIGKKIRISSLGQKNNILKKKKECIDNEN